MQHANVAARRLLFFLPSAARDEGTLARRVTALKFQKRTQERVNVYLDEEYAFALPALEAARLKVGQSLTDAEVAALRDTDSEQKAVDRALNFIGYRPRSRKEIERNLERAGIDEALIEKVIERLQRQGYVDDEAFARYWVENREQFRPRVGARYARNYARRDSRIPRSPRHWRGSTAARAPARRSNRRCAGGADWRRRIRWHFAAS